MRVDLSGQKFNFPQQCACCGQASHTTLTATASKSTGSRVVHTTTKSWDFPYCMYCVEHVKAANLASTIGTWTAILSLTFAALLYFLSTAPALGVLLGVGGTAGGVFAHKTLMDKARGMCEADCVCTVSAVSYLGWQGSCHMFEIISPNYALGFMVMNERKLVNVRPETWQWLQQNGYGTSPNQPQSPRRHIN